MADESYEVVLSGGGPFGFRLAGGKEFGRSLTIQSVSFKSFTSLMCRRS